MAAPKKTVTKKPAAKPVAKPLTFHEKIVILQTEIKAPKNQYNSFGKYKYRSYEDILEATKPYLKRLGLILTVNDEVCKFGDLTYIESVATISDGEQFVEAKAQAGININRKGMDIAQSFGSSSSYARKYALGGGLLLLDDTKDADATNTHGKDDVKVQKSWPTIAEVNFNKLVKAFGSQDKEGNIIDLEWCTSRYHLSPSQLKKIQEVANG